jgi:hypothetical protein
MESSLSGSMVRSRYEALRQYDEAQFSRTCWRAAQPLLRSAFPETDGVEEMGCALPTSAYFP